MSKINQIQNALKELDGGKFQKLGDSYLHYRGYKNLNSLGSATGTDKVRKGTPDSFTRTEDGKLVFVEHTTQQTGVAEKLKGDLEKCLDESKTGIPVADIEEIIFCHTSTLKPEEENELFKEGQKHKIKVHIYGIDAISRDLCFQYPGLARDFLGVSIDSGQILTPEEFVTSYDKSQYATPLATEFHFREEEIKNALGFLANSGLLLISGPAGIGKSRLALEILKQFKNAHPGYEAFCVRNRGQDLFEDLRIYFSRAGDFLILVDDANRVGKFDYLVHLLQDQKPGQRIKIIATVRDYALEKIKNATAPLGAVAELSIAAFEKEKIQELIQKLYKITNNFWLERIASIANGNPRLAVMAAKIAMENTDLDSIRDASSLYEYYFSSIREDLQELADENVLKVAGIICFLRSVDKTNELMMESIHKAFGIDVPTFWAAAQKLHSYELVDIYEKEVIKISDQVLATYLFYLCFFNKKSLKFEVIMNHFFPTNVGRIKDSLYPCLNAFNFDFITGEIRPSVSTLWDTYKKNDDEQNLRELIAAFWFILQTNTLTHVSEVIELLEPEPITLDSISWEASNSSIDSQSPLSLLVYFEQAEGNEFRIALELACRYIEKIPQSIPDALRLLKESFGFNRHAHAFNYVRQHIAIDALIARTKEGQDVLFSKLFLTLCKYYLRTEFDDTESHKKSITIHKFNLLAISSVFEFREKLWKHIFKLYDIASLREDVLRVIEEYSKSGLHVSVQEIAEKDAESLLPFILITFDLNQLSHCLIANQYARFLKRRNIKNHDKLTTKFTNDSYALYKLVAYDYFEKDTDLSVEEYDALKAKEIREFTKNYTFDDYKNFLSFCFELSKEVVSGHENYKLTSGVLKVLLALAERDSALYSRVIEHYLSSGEPFKLHYPALLIEKLTQTVGLAKAKEIIEGQSYDTKQRWIFFYFQVLPSEQISHADLEQLYALYKESSLTDIPRDYDYLLNYHAQDSQVVIGVTKILVERAIAEPQFGHAFDLLFNPYSQTNKQLLSLFKSNTDTLKKAYLLHESVDKHADHDGHSMSRILDFEPTLLQEHIDLLYENNDYLSHHDDSRNYSFLWKRKDAAAIMTAVIKQLMDRENQKGYIRGRYLQRFFIAENSPQLSAETIKTQDDFLRGFISDNATDINIMTMVFNTIAHFDETRQRGFIAIFLEHNKKFEDFEQLPFEPDVFSWSGSQVPMLVKRMEFWQALLPLCNSVEFLLHKKFIENCIHGLQKAIVAEKKSDFMDDD